MATWSDNDITAAVTEGRLGVEPWRPDDLSPNGLDLRIAEVLVPSETDVAVTDGTATVPPMTRFIVATEERLRLPHDVVGSLWIRSSYARRGVLASFGKVDAGFEGNLTIGAFHTGHGPLEIPVGDRFCQIVFESLQTPAGTGYAERSGNYQGQSGITMAK